MRNILKLWGKKKLQDEVVIYHPLLFHLIDVGNVVYHLVAHIFPEAVINYLKLPFDKSFDKEGGARLAAFLAALHDIGKASPVFQSKDKNSTLELKEMGFNFDLPAGSPAIYHGHISAWYLENYFYQEWDWEIDQAISLSVTLGGHHGFWFTAGEIRKHYREKGIPAASKDKESDITNGMWNEFRKNLIAQLKGLFKIPEILSIVSNPNFNAFCVYLGGIVSFADWIGSDERYFPYYPGIDNIDEYFSISLKNAERALNETGFSGWNPPAEFVKAPQLFHFEFKPRRFQDLIIEQKEKELFSGSPVLTIIEAPTGEGKTEAAWILADYLITKKQKKGAYFAMPTQATSNQMFSRVLNFIRERYPEGSMAPYLLHGNAPFSKAVKNLKSKSGSDDQDLSLVVDQWFLPKKRTLLAPFGVGTIDQALMAVLPSRHFFIRLFGLANKVIIFDEIHAYDTYMDTLFIRLLTWLRAIDCDVILLSATLPAKKRREFVKAYTGKEQEINPKYPALLFASQDDHKIIDRIQTEEKNPVTLKMNFSWDVKYIIDEFKANGGCFAVICNTVNRAQEVYNSIAEAGIVDEENLILFHARFPFFQREKIEKKIETLFGKDSTCRPKASIVIATQVIEQSLDLDFDRIFSDMAPIDLLIQRMGRLWRHNWKNRPFEHPCFTIMMNMNDQKPDFSSYSKVYAPYILLRSYLVLKEKNVLYIPRDVQPLIEEVYGNEETGIFGADWETDLGCLKEDLEEDMAKQEHSAGQKLLYEPDDESLFSSTNTFLNDDEDPGYHDALRATTRLIRPSVNLICLVKEGDSLRTLDGLLKIPLDRCLEQEEIEKLLLNKITISNSAIVQHFLKKPVPSRWEKAGPLRWCRELIFHKGEYKINEKLSIFYDVHTGIQYRSK